MASLEELLSGLGSQQARDQMLNQVSQAQQGSGVYLPFEGGTPTQARRNAEQEQAQWEADFAESKRRWDAEQELARQQMEEERRRFDAEQAAQALANATSRGTGLSKDERRSLTFGDLFGTFWNMKNSGQTLDDAMALIARESRNLTELGYSVESAVEVAERVFGTSGSTSSSRPSLGSPASSPTRPNIGRMGDSTTGSSRNYRDNWTVTPSKPQKSWWQRALDWLPWN